MKAKKNILYFVSEFPMLSQTFIEREIRTLVKLGNTNLTVFSFKKATGSTTDEVIQHTVFRRLKFKDIFKILIFSAKNYNSVLRELSWALHFMPTIKGMWLFVKAVGYASVFDAYKPDHIHVNFFSDVSTLVKISSGILQVPFSISAHAKDVFVSGHLISEKIKVAKFVTVCNSNTYNEVLRIAEEKHVEHKNVHLLFHGVPEFEAVQTDVKNYSSEIPLIVSLGRFVEKKGYTFVFDAIKQLKNEGLEINLIIAGFGPLYAKLNRKVQDLGLTDSIKILGSKDRGVPNEKIRTLLEAADIFVAGYIEGQDGDVDGIANVIVEAALARTPAVVTNSGGVTDLHDKTTALIIGQKDSRALAENIKRLLTDKQLANQLAENSYGAALAKFNLQTNVSKLEKLILED